MRRGYACQLEDVEQRVDRDLGRIGQPEYPRDLTVTDLVRALDDLLALGRQLLAQGHLVRAEVDREEARLGELRARVRRAG